MNNNQRTVKVTLEGDPDMVDAVSDRIREFFTVTYQSKDNHVALSSQVRRFLRLIPPGQAHPSPVSSETGRPPGEKERP